MLSSNKKNNYILFILLLLPILIFFIPVLFQGKLPIPADTIVGMYHPFRDVVWKGYSAGVPFKNFLITDAVRQQFPWRELAISLVKKGEFPSWNPYTFAGIPLAANIQTAIFYPFNILFFLFNFPIAWAMQVILQLVLLSTFTFSYLQEIGRSKKAALLASLGLTFSGFSVAWLEWNTTLHTLVWLPLALLAIEIIVKEWKWKWVIILIFSLASILFSGFLQTAFYAYLLILVYTLYKIKLLQKVSQVKRNIALKFLLIGLIVVMVTSVQWIPTARLISNSARDFDQGSVLQRQDWFIPWQHLVQFIAPDFFGNPSTLNYWGVFNYTEFIGYIGIVTLFFALLAVVFFIKRNTTKQFWIVTLFVSLVFATSNFISRIPFQLNIPLLSTAQPSRLIMLIDFSLAVLAAFGLDKFFSFLYNLNLKNKSNHSQILRNMRILFMAFLLIFTGLWFFAINGADYYSAVTAENLLVSRRNLFLPSLVFISFTSVIAVAIFVLKRINKRKLRSIAILVVFLLLYLTTAFDQVRFANKFTPFSDPDFLYPKTETIKFLESDTNLWRYMTTDRRIFPPNFSVVYRMQTIEGYDPIYLNHYGQLIASAQKGEPTLEPVAFKRILRPQNFDSTVFDVLNVKYVLSLSEINHPKLEKVFEEGETIVYKNKNAFPRAFVIPEYNPPDSDIQALQNIFYLQKEDIELTADVIEYRENYVKIEVESEKGGLLVLADAYYPGWKVTVDNNPSEVLRVLHSLRGTMVTSGEHEVLFSYSQL